MTHPHQFANTKTTMTGLLSLTAWLSACLALFRLAASLHAYSSLIAGKKLVMLSMKPRK